MVTKDPIIAKKSFGQNFLKDLKTLEKIVAAAKLLPGEQVLEIGPGRGSLTSRLLATQAHLTAVERDPELIPHLQEQFGKMQHFALIREDILRWQVPSEWAQYKVVANIPYYITKDIVNKFLFEEKNMPTTMVLMVQKEFGEKATGRAPHATFLSNMIGLRAKATLIAQVPRHFFEPAPKVDSAILRLESMDVDHRIQFPSMQKLLERAFAGGRKKMRNTLAGIISPKVERSKALDSFLERRPEELTPQEWQELYTLIYS